MSVHAHSYAPVFYKLQLMHGDVIGVHSCMHAHSYECVADR